MICKFFIGVIFSGLVVACSNINHQGTACQVPIKYSPVSSRDLLPQQGVNESFYADKLVVSRFRNISMNLDFVVFRTEVCGPMRYQDEFIVGVKGEKQAIDIEGYDEGALSKRYFNSPEEAVIACASEGPLLVFVLKNGLVSLVEIEKKVENFKSHTKYKLLRAVSHAKGYLFKEIVESSLSEKDCKLVYDWDEKAFVFYYVLKDSLDKKVDFGNQESVFFENKIISDEKVIPSKVQTFPTTNKKPKLFSLCKKIIFVGVFLFVGLIGLAALYCKNLRFMDN